MIMRPLIMIPLIAAIAGIVVVGVLHVSSASQAEPVKGAPSTHYWKTYYNGRFSYAACYPADVFSPQGEALNADGQRFLAKDGAEILVFGSNNVLNQSISEALNDAIKSFSQGSSNSITKKTSENNWFFISGSKGNRTFLQKSYLVNKQFKTIEVYYNQNTKKKYEDLASEIVSCFTAN